jgi:hypothetical protein
MKVAKNTVLAETLIDNGTNYIYKSVTTYDYKTDNVEYAVSGNNGDEFGRFESLEDALKVFASL